MEQQQLKNIIEAVLMSADKPLKVNDIEVLFAGDADMPSRDDIRKSLKQLGEDYQNRGFELREVASGYRLQVRQDFSQWVGRLWEEKPARYSRALLETIALIAYRQPITRGEIEEVRGVSVSSNIIKTLMEREWIKVLGHKDVPGKPALYGTSKEFLDYFNLKSLEDLPSLAQIKDLDQIHQELDLDIDNTEKADADGDAEASGSNTVADSNPDADADTDTDSGSDTVDEAGDVHAVAATAGNDASYEEAEDSSDVDTGPRDDDEGHEPVRLAVEADDAEPVDEEHQDESSAADTGTEEADEDPVVTIVATETTDPEPDEEDFAEAEPRVKTAAS